MAFVFCACVSYAEPLSLRCDIVIHYPFVVCRTDVLSEGEAMILSRSSIAVSFTVLIAACQTTSTATAPVTPATRASTAAAGPLGASKATSVEVCEPSGERAYLQRLRCPDGTAPRFGRAGSLGMRTEPRTAEEEKAAEAQTLGGRTVAAGEADYHVVDMYEVRCGDAVHEVFLDMYHCDQRAPEEAPEGFTIVPAKR
jgi:hypothetical protein